MKSAIITGTSSGIGASLAAKLLKMGYRVYGLSRHQAKDPIHHENFVPVRCDISDTVTLTQEVAKILEKEDQLEILINNAGVGYFAPHEEIPVKKLQEIVAVNLLAPMILTRLVLRELKKTQGFVINLASVTALKPGPFASAYAASKAGLRHFSQSLLEETRKSGVRVITINPDVTKTPFYDDLSLREHEDPESYILPEDVADALEMILNQRKGVLLSEITIQPQKHMITKKKHIE